MILGPAAACCSGRSRSASCDGSRTAGERVPRDADERQPPNRARHPRLQRGDGGRHDRLPAQRLRPLRAAASRRWAAALHAELFNVANTVPNMLYILLAGGIFNAVLVPQLVRTMKNDPDGGEAYANRIVTLAALFLGLVTVLLVVAAPWVMQLFLGPTYDDPALAAQRTPSSPSPAGACRRSSSTACSCWSGQILNARGRFGPMMWAPIANNLIAIAMLVTYLLTFGPADPSRAVARPSPRPGGAAGPRVDARHRRAAAGAAAVPARGRLPLPAALRLPGLRARPHPAARRLDGRSS